MKILLLILGALIFSTPSYGLCLINCEDGSGIIDGALERKTKEGNKSLNQGNATFKSWGGGVVIHAVSSGFQNTIEEVGVGNNAFYVEHYFSPYFSLGATYIEASFKSLKDLKTGENVSDTYDHKHLVAYFGSRLWITNSFQIFMHSGLALSEVDFQGNSWSGTGKVMALGFKYQSTNSSPMIGIQQTTITGSSSNDKANIGFASVGFTFGMVF